MVWDGRRLLFVSAGRCMPRPLVLTRAGHSSSPRAVCGGTQWPGALRVGGGRAPGAVNVISGRWPADCYDSLRRPHWAPRTTITPGFAPRERAQQRFGHARGCGAVHPAAPSPLSLLHLARFPGSRRVALVFALLRVFPRPPSSLLLLCLASRWV